MWIARLEVESTLARRIDDVGGSEKDEKWMETWREARECVRGEGTVGVWVWGLQTESERKSEILQVRLLSFFLFPLFLIPPFFFFSRNNYWSFPEHFRG